MKLEMDMLKRIADNRNQNSLASRMRKKRAILLKNLIRPLPSPIWILDVGGTETYWKMTGRDFGLDLQIVLLNLKAFDASCPSVQGDARRLAFKNKSFDVVFSNSVIEHVGSYEEQAQMAEEVRRVGKRYFVQTPNKFFPIEPHFLFPFFQFLPINIRVWLLRHFRLGWFSKTPDETKAREIVNEIRLLNKREFSSLFPGAYIYEEKILGLTKSFVAYGGWET